jgi:hypothetical protein
MAASKLPSHLSGFGYLCNAGESWPVHRICRRPSWHCGKDLCNEEIAAAARVYFDDVHQIAEGAGAAPLAALLKEREHMAAKNVAVVLTGGNIERGRFIQVLNGHTPSA